MNLLCFLETTEFMAQWEGKGSAETYGYRLIVASVLSTKILSWYLRVTIHVSKSTIVREVILVLSEGFLKF